MNHPSKTMRLFSGIWLIIVLLLAGYCGYVLLTQQKIQFDLLALLPQDQSASAQATNHFMQDTRLSNRIVILLGSDNTTTAKAALQQLRQQINATHLPIQEQNTATLAQDHKKLFTALYPYRAGLLATKDRQYLKKGQGELLANRALAQVMLPFSSFRSTQIHSDPFLLYPQFVLSLQPTTSLQRDAQEDVFITEGGTTWYLFQGNVTKPVFSLHLQQQLTAQLDAILNNSPAMILKTGALFYATAGAKQAKGEISTLGTCSIMGIILILLAVFRTVRPILLALSVVSSGLIGGLAACLYFLGSIHILALVFGCSLIGVAVDYALHYFCASYKQKDGVTINRFAVLKTLMPALPLGVLSSMVGYGLLIVAPFPGIQQMAILGGIGLLCTFISVCLWGPYFLSITPVKIPVTGIWLKNKLETLTTLGHKKYTRPLVTALLLTTTIVGIINLTFADNVRGFQSLDVNLKTQEDRIKALMQIDSSMTFFTMTANNLEAVLQTEERIAAQLDKLNIHYKTISQLFPSQQRQQENRQLTAQQLYQKHLVHFSQMLGLKLAFDANALGFNQPLFVPTDEDIKNLPTGWRELIQNEAGTITGRLVLTEPATAQMATITQQEAGVIFVDPIKHYSDLFASYRHIMTALVFIVLLIIALLLAFRKSFKAAIVITTPILLSILASIGVIGLLEPFTLFHAMGLLLVVCIGIDYALFLYWHDASAENNFLLLGNSLSAITTILSFGLLALSHTHAIHNFGLAVLVGIMLCFLATTLFLGRKT